MPLESYQDLKVWQNGMQIAQLCYQLTRAFPKEELFAMTSQIRRAATSIPANIAEGYGREGRGEYMQFLRIAQGSLKELETHLLISVRVDIVEADKAQPLLQLCNETGRMLHNLIRSLQK